MNSNQKNQESDEVDLSIVFNKIGTFFGNISFKIFKGILFIKKHTVKIVALFIIGFALGYFLDHNNTNYDSEIIVTPNMGGTDYLYSKIDLLSSKLKEKDYKFFNSIGIKNPKKIDLIEIAPIVDIYSFVNNSTSAANASNTQNFELVKLLSESSDINKVIKDELTSKNYPHHKIHIITNVAISEQETIKPLLKYLNTDVYLNEILAISKNNIKIKMKKNYELIAQTDSLIRILTINLTKNQKSSNLVYNNENNQFNSFFDLKINLINEIAVQKIALVNQNAIIKDVSTIINVKNTKGVNSKLKYILPFLFLALFFISVFIVSFYKKQASKLNS